MTNPCPECGGIFPHHMERCSLRHNSAWPVWHQTTQFSAPTCGESVAAVMAAQAERIKELEAKMEAIIEWRSKHPWANQVFYMSELDKIIGFPLQEPEDAP